MFRKLFIISTLLLLAVITVSAEKREIHILAINDAHAAIEGMPQLTAIADSLRTLYPALLLFSAGDNRTGDPINDKYEIPGYPMVAMMNLAGFHGSALGNHEFDAFSLSRLCGLSTFRYICANITADDSTGIVTVPYQVFDVEGMKVGVVGAIQVNEQGTPNAHPEVLRGLHFTSPLETVGQYEWLSRECDVTILLSHVGYEGDLQIAERYPWLDLIIGGHSHRQLTENEPLHNGVLVTQNRNLLGRAVHITLTVDNGRVVDKQTEYLSVRAFRKTNKAADALLQAFINNPTFKRVLAKAETPFKRRNEIGTMVCDALMDATEADVAVMNYRGIRVNRMPAGDITVKNALEIDPYGSNAVLVTMTGAELEKFIIEYGHMNIYKFPHLGGLQAELTFEKGSSTDIKRVKLTMADGKKINKKRTFRVVTNSYVIATYDGGSLEPSATVLNTTTSDIIMHFLEKQGTVDYQGKGMLKYLNRNEQTN